LEELSKVRAISGRFHELVSALEQAGSSPVRLLPLALIANALAAPYLGLVHDAGPYALQVLNHASNNALGHDLFLAFGSQDRFSVFSALAARPAAVVGLPASFFIGYLLSVLFFLEATRRLILRLFSRPGVAAAVTLFMAVAPVPYGGLSVFHVVEPFMTPRLIASALTLLAIERATSGRWLQAAVAALCGIALHPLMAAGGVLVIAGVFVARSLRMRWIAALAIIALLLLAAGLVAGLNGPFRPMDAAWREVVRSAAPYNFPDEWQLVDWLTVAGSLLLVTTGAWRLRHRQPMSSTVLWLACLAAVSGLFLTSVASHSTNAFAFQSQPYRAVWLTAVLQLPVAFEMLAELVSQDRRSAVLLAAIVLYLSISPFWGVNVALSLVAWSVIAGVVFVRGRLTRSRLLEVVPLAAIVGIALSVIVVALIVLRPSFSASFTPIDKWQVIVRSVGPLGLWTIAAGTLLMLGRRHATKRMAIGLVIGWVAIASAEFAWPRTPTFQKTYGQGDAIDALARHLDERASMGKATMTIYTNWAPPVTVWTRFHTASYFTLAQAIGVIFSRETAMEVARRAALVAPFEVMHADSDGGRSQVARLMYARLFPGTQTGDLPGVARLCADHGVDVLSITDVPEPARLSAGDISIVDCDDMVNRTASPPSAEPALDGNVSRHE